MTVKDYACVPSTTTVLVPTVPKYPTNPTCPNCGYCPHCGRGGFIAPYVPAYPVPYYPPASPWCNTGTVTVS